MKYIKYIPWLIVVIALGGLSFYFWRSQRQTEQLLSLKNKELMQANLKIGKAKTEIVNQAKLHKTTLNKIEKDLANQIKKNKEMIVSYGDLEAELKAEKKRVKTLTKVVYRDRDIDRTIDLSNNKLYIKQDEEFRQVTSLTYSFNDFRITINGDAIKKDLSYKLHQRFKGQLIETKLKSGGSNYYIKLFELDNNNKPVKELKLTKYEVLKANTLSNRMMWWNPKVDLGIGVGLTSDFSSAFLGEIGFSVAAYGKTSHNLIWRFARFGLGLSNNGLSLSFSPAQLNVATYLPLVNNLYLAPIGSYTVDNKSTFFGIGASVVF